MDATWIKGKGVVVTWNEDGMQYQQVLGEHMTIAAIESWIRVLRERLG